MPKRTDIKKILIIGSDPRGNLPFVESEANSIYEALEPVADVFLLTGAQAAFEDVVARLPKVDVIHYCGHIDRSRAGLDCLFALESNIARFVCHTRDVDLGQPLDPVTPVQV